MRRIPSLAAVALAAQMCSACVQHTHCTEWNGVAGIRGEPVEYQQTTVYALHLLFVVPLIGNASLERGIEKFTAEASARNARRISVEETEKTTFWYVFPPISFIIHPVMMEVGGQVEGTSVPPKQ